MDRRMATIHPIIAAGLISFITHLHGQELDRAEVRIPYAELKQLLARAEPTVTPPKQKPALLSLRLRLAMDGPRPVMEATFRTVGFHDEVAVIPLIGGAVSLDSQSPENAVILAEDATLCLASDTTGTRALQLRLLPILGPGGFTISIPPCPSVIFETGDLPDGQSVVLRSEAIEETLAAGQIRPLPSSGVNLAIRLLDDRETREAMRPPTPSSWTWQNQVLVIPAESDLIYHVMARASAADGSGVAAILPLPADAQDIVVSGEDLVSHAKVRGENRSLVLSLDWKTRGLLDRQVGISYRLPLRPLDRTWRLQAPGDAATRTRFIIATTPLRAYSAEGLSAPLSPQGLPAVFTELLHGGNCQHLEIETPAADLSAIPIPIAATDEGVVKQSEWTVKIEPDGAMLATGVFAIEHKSPLGFVFDTPQDMKLLSCELGGRPVSPVDLGGGTLKVTLPPQGGSSRLACSFSHTGSALDPVEGTMKLSLPQTPLFIHALSWQIYLPPGYQAETHGNLTRVHEAGAAPSRIMLRKNLCRAERPEIHVFYQRSDLNR